MSWDVDNEKLLCHLVVDDRLAPLLSHLAGEAYFRAFIVEHRQTRKISMKFRFHYSNGERSWFEVTPEEQSGAVEHLRAGMEQVLRDAAKLMNRELPSDAVVAFYPPDDGGDGKLTVRWLQKQGLIYEPRPAGTPRGGMTRDDHLAWAKARALAYLPQNPREAMTSMMSDLMKHPDLKNHFGLQIAPMFYGAHDDEREVRRWIEGFN